ncbi:MAG: hypothetical protein EBR89_11220 [Betaproteobacteria bacterium]|nr:hypothetical protein [Betaproteobacteria bacterium]
MSLSLFEASLQNPQLARLQILARTSDQYLALVHPLIPPALRASTKAGPIAPVTRPAEAESGEQTEWCLIAANSASAGKLRQLLPTLLQHLQSAGHPVSTIRLTIEKAPPGRSGASF